jgi:hypothetical protein
MNEMRSIFLRSIFIGPLLLTCHAGAQEHRFEDDPIVAVRENFVACDVLSQFTARHGKSTLSARRRMRTAACRRSGPRLREAWALFLHLSARPDVPLQMDA